MKNNILQLHAVWADTELNSEFYFPFSVQLLRQNFL